MVGAANDGSALIQVIPRINVTPEAIENTIFAENKQEVGLTVANQGDWGLNWEASVEGVQCHDRFLTASYAHA